MSETEERVVADIGESCLERSSFGTIERGISARKETNFPETVL